MKKYKVLRPFIDYENIYYSVGSTFYPDYDNITTFQQDFIDHLEQCMFIEEIPEQPKTIWELKEGDECWVIFYNRDSNGGGIAKKVHWHETEWQSARAMGEITLTEEECKKEIARRKAKQILLRDTKEFKPEPNNPHQCKWHIYWLIDQRRLEIDTEPNAIERRIYFATAADAEASIKVHEKEWKIYLGVEE